MRKFAFFATILINILCFSGKAEPFACLSNESCRMEIDPDGGAIVSFKPTGSNANPFTWKLTAEGMPANNRKGAPFQGHFICLGRWGDPTPGEIKAGMPNNGDIGTMVWSTEQQDSTHLYMKADSQLDYMEFERRVVLDSDAPLVLVEDRVKNTATIGRLFNIVQHATIGTPFFNTGTSISSNAGKGFMQDKWQPTPENFSYVWPIGHQASDGRDVDLRRSDGVESYVSSHVFNDSIGWITAHDPESGVILGYVWKTADYPWLNLWHQTVDGKPWAKGLEFGTTGVGAPYNVLVNEETDFFGNKSYFFFDAGEETNKKFACFILKVPADFNEVDDLSLDADTMTLTGKDGMTLTLKSSILESL